MKVFKHSADRLPIFIFVIYFVLDLFVFFTVDSLWVLALYFGLGIIPKGFISAWNHHHQHVNTFRFPILNRILEFIYSLQTGATGYLWVLHHNLGHHANYLDQSQDQSRWRNSDGSTKSRIGYDIEVVLTSYFRAFQVGRRHQRIKKYFLFSVAATLIFLALVTCLRPLQALFVFWLPMMASMIITADTTYDHHSDLGLEDHAHASRNIITSKWYNILSGNLGYHTAHHMRGGLHWSKLPDLHTKIKHKIPATCYREPWWLMTVLDTLDEGIRGRRKSPPTITS